jgi:hypothetical protein
METINKNYVIKNDALNWILTEEWVENKQESKHYGKTKSRALGYFSTVDSIASFLIEHQLKVDGINNLVKIKTELQEFVKTNILQLNNKSLK